MALERPPGFPEEEWIVVIAAEATARGELLNALEAIPFSRAAYSTYVDSDQVKAAVIRYLIALMSAFAEAACGAVRARRLPAIALDTAVELFFDLALRQAYWGLEHEKIRAVIKTSSFHDLPRGDYRPKVFAAPWHARYLADVPDVLNAVKAGQATPPIDQVAAKAGRRRIVLEPLLKAQGISAPQWADRAGVNQSVAYDYLNGKTDPRPPNRKALAEALGLDAEDLPP
jgi:hypothetical protein